MPLNHKASISFWTLLCTVTLAALAGACGGTENDATPTAAVELGTPASGDIGGQAVAVEKIPERDLFDLARRLGAASRTDLKRTVESPAGPYREGDVASFWVADLESVMAHTITATAKLVGADGAASVRDLPLNDAGSGQTVIEGFGSSLRHAVIVISPVTLGTRQPAEYKLVITPSG